MRATITSVAHYVPPTILDNAYFANYLDTTDEWILTRTGISERHISKEGATSDLIVPAAKECIAKRGLTPDDIDCIIVATVTPDHSFPATAALVQHKIGANNAWGYDMTAACSSFLFAFISACKLVESGAVKRLLLCGGDKMSTITDYSDRTQAMLFGDAAAVVLIEESNDPDCGIIDFFSRIDGSGAPYLRMEAGGSAKPPSIETVQNKEHYLKQDGQTVFKAAVKAMADVTLDIMKRNNLEGKDVAWFVPHQANMRIITATADRMGLPKEQVMINIQKYGNTTAATIPLCISEWNEAGKIKKGDNVIMSSFGAGWTYGSVLLRWNMNK
ncbi:MAG TPA: beta-ketoacyl-ACP synthase III [Candidatus Kapabacteria bacterium]|nr:beta-ketoacyl-ACP synthase III [Candidatus Kapabacteria bacterium]HPO61999.1 beta-ketoacyl-ACP synthase III [Candidatus Kapabacteria bacterium]